MTFEIEKVFFFQEKEKGFFNDDCPKKITLPFKKNFFLFYIFKTDCPQEPCSFIKYLHN